MKTSLLFRPCVRMASSRQLSTATKPIKLYGFPMSQPVRSVLLLCNTADIKYDFVLVNALKGDHLKPDFRKIHPAGLLPAIEEDGLGVLGECSAILVYLAETRKLEQWYPSDPIRRAHINFFLSWHHGNTRLATSGLIRNKIFPPKGGGAEEAIATASKSLSKSLMFLEGKLKTSKFVVAGDHPTIADLILLPELDQHTPEAFNMIDFTRYPNIQRWMKDVTSFLPSYRAVFDPVVKTYAAMVKT